MLDKKHFIACLNGILTLKDIPADPRKTETFYSLMKNDFGDSEFASICGDICRNETLYNKYPDPKLFYDRKVKIDDVDIRFKACETFCDKVQIYLLSGFIPESTKQSFVDGLTDAERSTLQRHGGISTLWSEVNRDSYPRSLGAVMKELRNDFEDRYQVQVKMEHLGIESYANAENLKEISNMVKAVVKRIGNDNTPKDGRAA